MQDKIQEIMGLVNKVQQNRVCAEMSPSNKDHFNALAEDAFNSIRSKLRELVREPLSDEEIEKSTGVKQGAPMFLAAAGLVRATERAHSITSAC